MALLKTTALSANPAPAEPTLSGPLHQHRTIDVESGTLQFNSTFGQTGGTWDIGVGGLMIFNNTAARCPMRSMSPPAPITSPA